MGKYPGKNEERTNWLTNLAKYKTVLVYLGLNNWKNQLISFRPQEPMEIHSYDVRGPDKIYNPK